jgi:hypothetical protein
MFFENWTFSLRLVFRYVLSITFSFYVILMTVFVYPLQKYRLAFHIDSPNDKLHKGGIN